MACTGNTPPPEDYQKWYDELYADLPDLPDASQDSSKSKYDFRIGVRENITVPITYLDQDESGTFDPACKKPPECIPINRKRRERRERIHDGTPKKLKSNTWQGGRWMGRRLPVVLRITSENGRAALKDFGTSLDNWPEHSPDLDSSDDSPTEWPEFRDQPYGLRERRECALSETANAAGDDDLHLEDVTLGYPAYRGCKGCFDWGFRCPLLDEGSRYPCAECAADSTECELIVEPTVKHTCEGCRGRRQQCSYRDKGADHTKPCQQCAKAFRKCVAGPASGRTRTGPSLDQGALRPARRPRKENLQPRKQNAQIRNQVSQPRRPKASCTQCLRDKKWCSRIVYRKQTECNDCCEGGTTCTIASLDPQITTSDKGKGREHEVCGHERSKPAAAQPTQSNRCRTITTKLAHPIQFNYAYDDDEGTAPCHWCEDAMYGILGLGEVEVEVIDNEDGQGFIEIADGHAETYGHSRMCQFCTTDRLRITACKNHEFEPIEGMDPESFDYKAVEEWMMPGMASLAPFAWCSICPSPAFFSCSTKPDIDMDGQEEDLYLGDQKGCGLLLCEACAINLVSEHEGKLDRMIDSMENDRDHGGFRTRADASFLHPNGELLRRMGGLSSTFLVEPTAHAYHDVASPAQTEKTGHPAPKVNEMGGLMALNGYWDNTDDDEPGMFKKGGS